MGYLIEVESPQSSIHQDSSTSSVLIIHVISPKLTNYFTHRDAVPRLETLSTDFALFDASTLGYEHSKWWWARPDLNWRSSPCQGDVITPRPRALVPSREPYCRWMIRIWSVQSSDDLRDFSIASSLWACSTHALTSIAHGEVFHILDWAVCFAF